MRFLYYASVLFCTIGMSVGAQDRTDKFSLFNSRSGSKPLELNDALYEEITSTPRDYHVAVLLTALESRFGCVLCRDFHPEWDVIARSWSKAKKNEDMKLLLGTLDFSNGKNTFQKLMLQTAPIVLMFPPTVGPFASSDGTPSRFEFSGPVSANQIYAWINRQLPEGEKPPLTRPINYTRLVSAVFLLLGAITLFTVVSPYVLPFLQSRNLWAAGSLIAILLFTSGHMFNHIRKVPYVAGDGRGGMTYFAGGFSNQLGMETQIIAAIYGILSFATISLAVKVPRMVDPKTQQMAVIIWSIVLLGTYSFLLMVFRIKNGGYPFYLPPF